MAHFDDLSSYQYGYAEDPNVVHVGWLGRGHDFTRGAVEPALILKMKGLAESPVELYRGYHVCELCEVPEELRTHPFSTEMFQWEEMRQSNGEIRVSRQGVIYAAPVLIVHYIEEHGYRPPSEFLLAIEEA